jgi:ABC-type transporter Mla subunit MlaD
MKSAVNRLVEVTDKLVDTTARQEQDINRLVEVTDRQAKTVDKQAQTVDRLALLLERVLVDRGQNN